jgi:hypothetical protein
VAPTPRARLLRPSRRSFLAGAGAAATLVAAGCASSTTSTAGTTPTTNDPNSLTLAPRFDANTYALAGVPARLVTSVVTLRNEPPATLPAELEFRVTRDGTLVGEAIPTTAHEDGVPVAYFPVRTTLDEPGTYRLEATVDGTALSTPFTVSDPSTSTLVEPGQPMRPVPTPTTVDARGVDPICTRRPDPCPYHDLDLPTALAAGAPTALLVSTPQFCQIGVCGPVLNLLIEAIGQNPGITPVHAEVYATPEGPEGGVAPVVDELGLTFEPSLFVIGADGVVVERLDYVFDRTEIAAAFAKVGAVS